MTTSELVMTVMVETRSTMDRQLAEAVDIARAKAMDDGSKGIVITRHNSNVFTMTLSDDVPFGLTIEQQL